MMEKEFQADPKIVQEATDALPRFMQEVEAAMMNPIQSAFREWFQSNSPALEKMASFKAVEQAFVAVVLQQNKAKDELRELMKNVAGPGGDVDKLASQYWQMFEDMLLTKCKILAWQSAGKVRPEVFAKILSHKLVLMAVMDDIRGAEMLSGILADELLKLFTELKKLAPKK